MKKLLLIILLLIPIKLLAQISSDKAHELINEVIFDNYYEGFVLDSIAYTDKIKIDGYYVQQNLALLNEHLTGQQIRFLLTAWEPTKCFTSDDEISLRLYLCDSTIIHVTAIDDRITLNETTKKDTFIRQKEKLHFKQQKKKRNETLRVGFSKPLADISETVMIVHVVISGNGKTVLFKKIKGKWTRICDLHAWNT